VPKRNGTESIRLYLPGLATHMKIDIKTLKSWILKVGGVSKINVKFADSINRGAVEIPRRIIHQEILKELDKGILKELDKRKY